jgi:MtN3 and saliva related transmembrane protein
MVELESFIGYVAGSLITLSLLPQLFIILYNKDSKNVSILTYLFLLIARCLWVIYGIKKIDLQIGITNGISGVITIIIIIVAFIYKKKKDIEINNEVNIDNMGNMCNTDENVIIDMV